MTPELAQRVTRARQRDTVVARELAAIDRVIASGGRLIRPNALSGLSGEAYVAEANKLGADRDKKVIHLETVVRPLLQERQARIVMRAEELSQIVQWVDKGRLDEDVLDYTLTLFSEPPRPQKAEAREELDRLFAEHLTPVPPEVSEEVLPASLGESAKRDWSKVPVVGGIVSLFSQQPSGGDYSPILVVPTPMGTEIIFRGEAGERVAVTATDEAVDTNASMTDIEEPTGQEIPELAQPEGEVVKITTHSGVLLGALADEERPTVMEDDPTRLQVQPELPVEGDRSFVGEPVTDRPTSIDGASGETIGTSAARLEHPAPATSETFIIPDTADRLVPVLDESIAGGESAGKREDRGVVDNRPNMDDVDLQRVLRGWDSARLQKILAELGRGRSPVPNSIIASKIKEVIRFAASGIKDNSVSFDPDSLEWLSCDEFRGDVDTVIRYIDAHSEMKSLLEVMQHVEEKLAEERNVASAPSDGIVPVDNGDTGEDQRAMRKILAAARVREAGIEQLAKYPSEEQVLRMLVEGSVTTADIARATGMAESSAQVLISTLRTKRGLSDLGVGIPNDRQDSDRKPGPTRYYLDLLNIEISGQPSDTFGPGGEETTSEADAGRENSTMVVAPTRPNVDEIHGTIGYLQSFGEGEDRDLDEDLGKKS